MNFEATARGKTEPHHVPRQIARPARPRPLGFPARLAVP